ncbi:2-oxoglutarate dehydrogenase E1 component [Saccharibacter sp. 17.LH.SD]|uniref:2-oxoglutarate dehydrogenase E1 component n=1 Tax=Saccharibacter sp. 17.LH.SD TaxID=2689393 RepID=UPI00136C1703|nr:2-oxoglutarate dehydrogenase E1 component [Saccharibacter sp. 17.LH.SD]MXV45003.1 2-oxoglutarate dehydrogenase E1 component [Saccharibacter sp. 17.LH.SD]
MTTNNTHESRHVINGENLAYLSELHALWQKDPTSVDPSFAMLFATLGEVIPVHATPENTDELKAERLKNAFRFCGHLHAKLDPLGLQRPRDIPALCPQNADPSLLAHLRQVYCGAIGAEFMHLLDDKQRQWWIDRFETPKNTALPITPAEILALLTRSEGFEAFCQQRFTGMRRFGLEGSESLNIALQTLINKAIKDDVRSISLGMPHRGRLNVMANILQKPYEAIFSEFAGKAFHPEGIPVSGDVKYHLGTATTLEHGTHRLRMALLPNPSHLEAVDPIVMGRVRADQDREKDVERNKFLGILVHGDAAFAGQGVVYESLQLSRLKGYRTGGTVHLIVNNQIGFTTSQQESHSGIWNSDVAKTVQAPILHVNGDDPNAVARCAALAHDWRQEFGTDIVIDIIAYRRHGHNETDDPGFTQPAMVHKIQNHPTVRKLYAEQLQHQGQITTDDSQRLWDETQASLQEAFDKAQTYRPDPTEWLDYSPQDPTRLQDTPQRIQPMTGVPLPRLHDVAEKLTATPRSFHVHPRLARQLKTRDKTLHDHGPIDWATAEALAFGTLALDGHPVRLSGQDSERGTFSQRHAVLTDQKTGETYTPLAHISRRQAPVHIWNSPLSEYGVLGFEYGYSLGNPEALVLWEAQFGDFANGGQIIIDQFLAAGETKWLRTSGLTLLLPHGYEGAGPEHSSARPERFLQLCAENNLRVCMPTTPANFFHALRRQIARRCRKPLIVFSPKSLLRHKHAVSQLEELGPHTRFQPVLEDHTTPENAQRLVICSGKVYYDLLAARDAQKLDNIALIRMEQLYPYPHHALADILSRHLTATDIIWCQEEPRNSGAWRFIDRRIEYTLRDIGHPVPRLRYVGRDAAASPATGNANTHKAQQEALVKAALTGREEPELTPPS